MIIGLSGKKRSGKDTVAEYLCAQYGFINYGFGDPIKEIARIMFQFSEEQLYGNQKDMLDVTWGIKPREFFQKFGTEYGQFILPDHHPEVFEGINSRQFWVKCFWRWYQVKLKENPHLKVVISDVRFLHELTFIKEKGGYIIKVNRNGILKDGHLSEMEIDTLDKDDFNATIDNNGTLAELHSKIIDLLN